MNSGMWALVSATDWVSKGVLLFLFVLSIICWAIAFYKRAELRAKVQILQHAKELVQSVRGMDDFLARISVVQMNFAGNLMASFLGDFKRLLKAYEGSPRTVSDKDWYLVQASIYQRIDETVSQEESLLQVLSTSAAISPLLGLFGTVWGLIHAFMAISEQRTADIAAVAPGIAEALLTTLAGLLVAIPAVALFSYLQARVREVEHATVELGDACLWIMRGVLTTERVQPAATASVKELG